MNSILQPKIKNYKSYEKICNFQQYLKYIDNNDLINAVKLKCGICNTTLHRKQRYYYRCSKRNVICVDCKNREYI